jgi:UDP-N-acetylglucosamine--N-acetylmuramyl-(pentapeptide) pyrophosphoryl-undecaprenol N-acetylglucosamine transferase
MRTILIAAGGTGGHLFPGIAVADELARRDASIRVVFVGTSRGLESRLVPRAGYDLELLPVRPLNRVGAARLLLGLVTLPWGLWRAFALVRRLRPEAVLGVGGYAGGPVVLAASLLGVRTVILEPNARPGFTNRVLRRFADRAACAYEETVSFFGEKAVLTGNPVRGGFASLPPKEHRPPLTLLAFGGSQGSRILNRALLDALEHLPPASALRIVHQTGEAMREDVSAAYVAAGRDAEVVAFLDDMETRVAAADLVVSRSGATTCAELTAAGKAAVLVPFARAADDHQRINARALEAGGAARVIEEKDLTGQALAVEVGELVAAPELIATMEQAARRLARPDAAARVADLLERKDNHGDTETRRKTENEITGTTETQRHRVGRKE